MSIEAEYRAHVVAMSVVERIRRAEALLAWSRSYLARSIAAARGPMSEYDLKLEIALREYGADPQAKELIEELRCRVAR